VRFAFIFFHLNIRNTSFAKILPALFVMGCFHFMARADDDDMALANTNSWTPQNSRFGLFDALDHRSGYYADCFPQPLLVDDTGLEPGGELELNYLHTAAADEQQSDIFSAEVQKSFGLLTFELEVPYEHFSDSDDSAHGIGNIELNSRCPFFQFVSANGFFDTTLGVSVDGGIPVQSEVSKNAEINPGVFNDLKIGDRFSIQTLLGYDKLFGDGDDGGSEEFEYGLAFAYTIPHKALPIPGVVSFSPLFEVNGELGLNEDEAGQNDVLGSIGFRANFKSFAGLEPSLGLGYIFPMNSIAREDVRWGIAVNLTFEF
jgi:hypothetical protein